MNKSDLLSEYEAKKSQFEQLILIVKFHIKQELDRKKIKIHSFPSRIKTFDSFINKIEKDQAQNPFWDIKDVVGLRVVCLFLDEVKKVGAVIEDLFDIIDKEDKIEGGDKRVFGYMDLQYKAKLKDKNYEQIKDIPFEVQIRTVTQDAWASISHHLGYKKGSGIPESLERDFNALSGLFYVADTHFKMLSKNQLEDTKSKLENE